MRTCALFLTALAACAQGVNFYSLEKEAELGATMAEAMLKQKTPTSHPEVRAYVQRLALKIASESPAAPLDASGRHFQEYKVAVIVEDTPDTHGTHEPVVLPGGYIVVSQSLILAAKDEAEFAGMLAHTMAHVAERHATRLLTRTEIAEFATKNNPAFANEMRKAADTMMNASLLTFRREFETEADAIAVKMAAAARFDPEALARYVGRTQVDEKAKAFSTLPSRDARLQKIENAIADLPARSYSSSDEFLEIQQQLR